MRWCFVGSTLLAVLAFAGSLCSQTNNQIWVTGPNFQTAYVSGHFVVPAGVTRVKVEAWGRGGSPMLAGPGVPLNPSGGGGGGAYASSMVDVAPRTTYRVTIDGDATFAIGFPPDQVTTVYVHAKRGSDVPVGSLTGGKGGQATDCIGTIKYSGGDGGSTFAMNAFVFFGGGGGGAAGPTGNGSNGTNGSMGTVGIGGNGFARGGSGGSQNRFLIGYARGGETPGGGSGGGNNANGGDSGQLAPGRAKIHISW